MGLRSFASSARIAGLVGVMAGAYAPLLAAADQPSYASTVRTETSSETIYGTVYAVSGRYTLTLADDRGFNDDVRLHDGTIITPTGLFLAAGQVATIVGHSSGKTFSADEIDVDPATVYNGQAFLPAPTSATPYGYGVPLNDYGYPLYLGTDNPYAGYYPSVPYGVSGTLGYGGYGGYATGGYYGGGPSYQTGPQTVPGQTYPAVPLPHRPIYAPAPGAPPGYRFPTGGGHFSAPTPPYAPPIRTAPARPGSLPGRPAAPSLPPPVAARAATGAVVPTRR